MEAPTNSCSSASPTARSGVFELRFLDSNTVQIEAAEITELYRLSEELYENTIRLQDMQKRQKALLDSIVEVNLNKEILTAKMHIHDELGHCLLATTKAITEDSLAENADTLRKSWNSTIQDFPIFLPCGRFRFLSAARTDAGGRADWL